MPWDDLIKRITSVDKGVEKLESSYIAGRMVQLLWKTAWQFLKRLHRVTICPSYSTPGCIPQRSKTYVHTKAWTQMFIYIIAAHIVETTQVSSCDEWINCGIFDYKMGWSIIIDDSMDIAWKYYGKWKKSCTKDHILYDSTYMTSLKRQYCRSSK